LLKLKKVKIIYKNKTNTNAILIINYFKIIMLIIIVMFKAKYFELLL
jgi:hypothetical protein